MKTIMKRLKSKAGETLVESMAAILIFTFGSIIMLSMVSSAADINTVAKEADQEFLDQMLVIEKASDGGTSIQVNFILKNDHSNLNNAFTSSQAVMYGSAENGLYAYYAPVPAAPAEPAGEGGAG